MTDTPNLVVASDPTSDRIARLERELESLRSGRRWQTAALWALFILLVAFAFGAAESQFDGIQFEAVIGQFL